MSFLENFGRKAGEIAQAAAKKSSELVEVTKISMNIASDEDKIKKIYTSIGQKVYEEYCSNPEQYRLFSEQLIEIDQLKENVRKLKSRLLDARNLRICEACDEEIDKKAAYCPKCGSKQQPLQDEACAETSSFSCHSCGANADEDAAFCSACGTKLKE